MTEPERFPDRFRKMLSAVLSLMEQLGLRYYIHGGVAANALARPRATADVDVTLLADRAHIDALLARLARRPDLPALLRDALARS